MGSMPRRGVAGDREPRALRGNQTFAPLPTAPGRDRVLCPGSGKNDTESVSPRLAPVGKRNSDKGNRSVSVVGELCFYT